MRRIGMIRKTDDLGRIMIPKEIRDAIGVGVGGHIPMEICLRSDGVIELRVANNGACALCGAELGNSYKVVSGKSVCNDCVNMVKEGI